MPNATVNLDLEFLKLDNQLCFPLYAASRLIIQAYAPALETLKLTYPQYLVMLVLWENETLSVKELGNKLFLDSGTLTPLLQKLESNQLIMRTRSPRDDRTVLNTLTPKGRSLQAVALQAINDVFCNSGLMTQESADLKEMLSRFIQKVAVLNA